MTIRDAGITAARERMSDACAADFAVVGGGLALDGTAVDTRTKCGLIEFPGFVNDVAARQSKFQVMATPSYKDRVDITRFRQLAEAFPTPRSLRDAPELGAQGLGPGLHHGGLRRHHSARVQVRLQRRVPRSARGGGQLASLCRGDALCRREDPRRLLLARDRGPAPEGDPRRRLVPRRDHPPGQQLQPEAHRRATTRSRTPTSACTPTPSSRRTAMRRPNSS